MVVCTVPGPLTWIVSRACRGPRIEHSPIPRSFREMAEDGCYSVFLGGVIRRAPSAATATQGMPGELGLRDLAWQARTSGVHPAAVNMRTIAVGADDQGRLWAASSNGFDRGQRATLERLGITPFRSRVVCTQRRISSAACPGSRGSGRARGCPARPGSTTAWPNCRLPGSASAMSEIDDEIDRLAGRVDALSIRAKSALFRACARGLSPAFSAWNEGAENRDVRAETLVRALDQSLNFAVQGTVDPTTPRLLGDLGKLTPPGEAVRYRDATAAQDCWICLDVSIRVMVDPTFDAGPCAEYALEPVLRSASERLPGAIGSESARLGDIAILKDSSVRRALRFLRYAVTSLHAEPAPPRDLVEDLSRRATALMP